MTPSSKPQIIPPANHLRNAICILYWSVGLVVLIARERHATRAGTRPTRRHADTFPLDPPLAQIIFSAVLCQRCRHHLFTLAKILFQPDFWRIRS